MDYDSAANSDAGAGRPPVLADPARRVEGLVVDALAFADDELTDAERNAVDQLILQEMKQMLNSGKSLSSYQSELPTLRSISSTGASSAGEAAQASGHSVTPAIDAALRDIAAGKKLLEGITWPPTSAFETVQAPSSSSSSSSSSSGTDTDVAAWEQSVAKAQVAVEAQTLKAINVELAGKYSVEQWKLHVDSLAKAEENARKRVQKLADEIAKVQETRRATQERAKSSLQTYNKRKYAAMSSINAVAPAVADARAEVKRLKKMAVEHGLIVADDEDDDEESGNN